MGPKPKKQKMTLSDFLVDGTGGSWADEMDSLPTGPAARPDDGYDRERDHKDWGSRPDRAAFTPREEVPLPTQPPFTAFVGNLAFDMTEADLGEFFAPHETVSVKIIADREGKPKGFGYVEFVELEGLKDALAKSGMTLSNRAVRVNVAEPPKERERGGFGREDDEKFSGNWRRDGPLPGGPDRSGFGGGSRYGDDDGPRRGSRFAPMSNEGSRERPELESDWRSTRQGPLPPPPERENRKTFGGGFAASQGETGAADAEGAWSKGSKFKPSQTDSDAGSVRPKFGSGNASPSTQDEGDWRRPRQTRAGSFERSPTTSVPPTPPMGRKRLELLPRSASVSTANSPVASPVLASSGPKASPFGGAKPVDVSAREHEVEERLQKEKDETAAQTAGASSTSRFPLSREPSRQGTTRSVPHPLSRETSRQGTTRGTAPSPTAANASARSPAAANVRPAFSFADAAGRKDSKEDTTSDDPNKTQGLSGIEEKISETTISG